MSYNLHYEFRKNIDNQLLKAMLTSIKNCVEL